MACDARKAPLLAAAVAFAPEAACLRGMRLSLLLACLLPSPSAADPTPPSNAVGATIGGHLEGALICQGAPQTILNHTVSEGAIGGVLNYFWTTQSFRQKEVRPPACPSWPGACCQPSAAGCCCLPRERSGRLYTAVETRR